MDLDIFKLEKLKISAFKEVDRNGKPVPDMVFEAMFNPTSYARTYALAWGNCGSAQRSFTRSDPSELSLNLILDGTGVNEMGVLSLVQESVKDRVEKFLDVTYRYAGDIHEPYYLIVEWGMLSFSCRLSTATVTYTLFDRDGNPLRAELAVRLVSDESTKKVAQEQQQSSPDLTHSRIVRAGDTLPLLTKQIYGSSARYLDVARFNGLDDFRNLTPGREMLFPPLARLDAGGSGQR